MERSSRRYVRMILTACILVWCKLCNAYNTANTYGNPYIPGIGGSQSIPGIGNPAIGINSMTNAYYGADIFEDQEYWKRVGRLEIENALRRPINWNTARNVVVMVGAGMDANTVTASRIYKEKEEGRLSFERFPNLGMLKTYSTNKKVPDSAAAGTALFTGVKTNNGVVGVDGRVRFEDCMSSIRENAQHVDSIMSWAQEAGKHTGFVTNKRVTDSMASALYARSASRFWECNNFGPDSQMCKDIGKQLVENFPGKDFKVIFGGGRQSLMTNAPITSNDRIDDFACSRTDGKNLIEAWQHDKNMRNLKGSVIYNTDQLLNLETSKNEYVLGIFSNSYLPYEVQRNTSLIGQPSLELMIEPAIKILRRNNRYGFMLMVEGGLIDRAHHDGHARKAIEETLEFDKAVRKTMQVLHDLGILEETLVIVTGGLGHTMSINGYPNRNESILGIADYSKHDRVAYTTLTYATGSKINYQYTGKSNYVSRDDPSYTDTTNIDYAQQAAILTDKETHGGGDVPVYATGPMAHLFHSVHEQTYVAHVIAYAARIGPYRVNSAVKSTPTLIVAIICTSLTFTKIF